MLISNDFVFLHFPKTAGKSLTKYMIGAWSDPIRGYISKNQGRELADVMRPGVTLEVTGGHEDMRKAAAVLRDQGRRIRDMKAVFVCVRNPYDIAVSTYFFLRETYPYNLENRRFQAASEKSFEEFWLGDVDNMPQRWLTLNGKVPANRRIIRYESLPEDLDALSREFGFRDSALPRLNVGSRDHYSVYMTPRAEAAIFERYRYLFDAGHYVRETFDG